MNKVKDIVSVYLKQRYSETWLKNADVVQLLLFSLSRCTREVVELRLLGYFSHKLNLGPDKILKIKLYNPVSSQIFKSSLCFKTTKKVDLMWLLKFLCHDMYNSYVGQNPISHKSEHMGEPKNAPKNGPSFWMVNTC